MAQRKKLLRVSWTPRAPLAGHSWIMFDFGSSPSVSLLLWVYISICCKSNITCVIYIIQGSSMQNDHLSVRRPFCFNTQPPNSVWYPSPSIEINGVEPKLDPHPLKLIFGYMIRSHPQPHIAIDLNEANMPI